MKGISTEGDKQVFLDWMSEIKTIKDTLLPRIFFSATPENAQLLISSEASLEAMCIVAYFCAEMNDEVEVSFVFGKRKIAPIN